MSVAGRRCDNGRLATPSRHRPSPARAGGVRRTDGHHATHEDHVRDALRGQRGAAVRVRRRARAGARRRSAETYPMIIGGEERLRDETFEDRSPIDRDLVVARFPIGHAPGRARRDRRRPRRLPGLARHAVARAPRRSSAGRPTSSASASSTTRRSWRSRSARTGSRRSATSRRRPTCCATTGTSSRRPTAS